MTHCFSSSIIPLSWHIVTLVFPFFPYLRHTPSSLHFFHCCSKVVYVLYVDWCASEFSYYSRSTGILRNDSCVYVTSYQAYKCPDYTYKMLVVESMDSDTETRRVSPVAVLSGGYIDLINGPQDHGWCSGYTCQKRLSTFPIIVATGKDARCASSDYQLTTHINFYV